MFDFSSFKWVLLLLPLLGVCEEAELPRFLKENPTSLRFSNTNGTILHCEISVPGAEYTWFERDVQIYEDKKLRIMLNNGSLLFPPFSSYEYDPRIHSSKYECRVRYNKLGLISTPVTLYPVIEEGVEVRVKDVYVYAGNSAILRCDIPYHTTSFIHLLHWKDGTGRRLGQAPGEVGRRTDEGGLPKAVRRLGEVFGETGKYSVLTSGELIIHHSSSYDEYTQFKCTALDTLTGKVYESNVGRVFVTDSPGTEETSLTFPEKNSSKLILVPGEHLRVACVGRGVPAPETIWYLERDGELRRLVPSSRIQIHLETLTILQINPEDSGIYTCHVTNSILQDSARFDILVVPELEVVLSPTQQRARKGDNITLTCSTRGKIESVSWFRNGYRIQLNNQRYRYSTDQSILNIFNLEEDEGGIYQCFVNTANQTKQSAAVVLIQDSAPEIVERFTGSTLIPGQFLSLKCVGRGRPPPRFIWELDGFKIQLGDRYRQSQYVTSADDVMSQLNLTHVTDRDGGLYSCRAENTAGQTSHSEQIRVFGPPYIRDVGPVSGVEGSQLRVQCPVSGYPIDKITWEKDGGPVVSSSALQVYNNGTMIFRAGNKGTDPGEYTCTATTIGSSYSRTIQINIVVPPRMIEFSFYDLQEGMRTAVTCQTVDGELPIKFSWFRDGERVQDGDGETVSFQQTTYSSTLFIQKLDRKHTGKYTCTATNMAGEDSRSADLLVNVPPEWIVEPKNVEITAGEQISVPCSAFGVPEPRIIWEREGSNGKMNPQISSRTGLLDIPGADETLEGEYTCRVENGVEPSIMKTIRIDVKSPPRFRRRDQERRINRGSEEILECSAEGDPKIEYIWSRDGRIINPLQFKRFSIREENTTEGEISLLRVHRVTEEDSGEFRCEGINGYGRDTLNFHLIILDVPGVPANLSVGEISSRSGTLSWEPPFSGNSGILHYTVHSVQGSGTGAVNEITVSGQSRSLIIRSLTPGKDYSLTVRAHNAIGPSNSSKPVSFTTLEEAPTGRVRIISLTARSSSSLKLVWESPPQSLWNSQQLGYTISYRLQESRADYELMNLPVSSDTQFSILLESLEKYRTYEVLIETWNLVGRGEKSVPYLATTLEDVPTGSPQNVRCEPKSSRSLIFSWDLPTLSEMNGEIIKFSYKYFNDRYPDDIRTGELEKLELRLEDLYMFTNYSLYVRAHTKVGGGPLSLPITCTTMEDVPGSPARVKVLSNGDSSFYVSWLPPAHPCGYIRRYTVYWRIQAQGAEIQTLKTKETFVRLGPLQSNTWFDFWVRAETRIGQGPSSPIETILAQNTGNAQIVSFGQSWRVKFQTSLLLDCFSVGFQHISTYWRHNGNQIYPGEGRVTVLTNNSLLLTNLTQHDEGEYQCEVENRDGADRIVHQVEVESPPPQPWLEVRDITGESAELVWNLPGVRTRSQGSGSNPEGLIIPIQGYIISYRHQNLDWIELRVSSISNKYTLTNLSCGSSYLTAMVAVNRIGQSQPSRIISFDTLGGAPSVERLGSILLANRTSILVLLNRFSSRQCKLNRFIIEFKSLNSSVFTVVSSTLSGDITEYLIRGLQPATRYIVRVAALNSAGDIQVEEEITTLDEDGRALNVYKTGSSGSNLVLIFFLVMGVPGVFTGLGFLAYFTFKNKFNQDGRGREVGREGGGGIKPSYHPHKSKTCSNPPHFPRTRIGVESTDDLYGDVCPYATVQLVKEDPGFSTLYHEGFVYGDKFGCVESGSQGANLYSQINQMETFRLENRELQCQEENLYSEAFQPVVEHFQGSESEQEEQIRLNIRKQQRQKSQNRKSSDRLGLERTAVEVTRVKLDDGDFDPFDFPPKRKRKVQQSGYNETPFY